MTPYLLQLSPRRYVVLWPRYSGVTGGTVAGGTIEFRWADLAFGPATYDQCMDWLTQNGG